MPEEITREQMKHEPVPQYPHYATTATAIVTEAVEAIGEAVEDAANAVGSWLLPEL